MGGQCGHEHLLNTSAIFKVTVHLSRWEAATMPERRLLHVVRFPGRFVYLRDAARSVPSDLERRVNSPAQIICAGARSSYTSLSFTRSIGSTPLRTRIPHLLARRAVRRRTWPPGGSGRTASAS